MKRILINCLALLNLATFGFAGCTKNNSVVSNSVSNQGSQIPTIPVRVDTMTLSYLALGDSYTIGAGVDPSERYPAQAVAMLATKGLKISPIQYVAQTGWTTVELASAIASQNLKGSYDIVTLLIGVNDQYQFGDTTGYRANFSSLLKTSLQLAGNRSSRVIVLSIPDYGITIFGSAWPNVGLQIDAYNAINRSLTLANHIAYLDITGISRQAASTPGLILGAGPHFTGAEYALWAAPLADLITKAITK